MIDLNKIYHMDCFDGFKQIDDNSYEIDANLRLDTVNEKLDINLPENELYSTINGMLTNLIGHIPQVNETFEINNYNFKILKSSGNKIDLVLFTIK